MLRVDVLSPHCWVLQACCSRQNKRNSPRPVGEQPRCGPLEYQASPGSTSLGDRGGGGRSDQPLQHTGLRCVRPTHRSLQTGEWERVQLTGSLGPSHAVDGHTAFQRAFPGSLPGMSLRGHQDNGECRPQKQTRPDQGSKGGTQELPMCGRGRNLLERGLQAKAAR